MGEGARQGPSNVETLMAAGLIKEGLPKEYYPVFESLSEEELAAILLVKARLDATRGRLRGKGKDYVSFVLPP
jgi:hypothetical protein